MIGVSQIYFEQTIFFILNKLQNEMLDGWGAFKVLSLHSKISFWGFYEKGGGQNPKVYQ